MDRSLDSLSSECRPLVVEVLARLVERDIPVKIVQTMRTEAEHATNIANGTSKTARTRHFPRRLRGLANGGKDDDKCDAIDICPYAVYDVTGPDKLQWNTAESPEAIAAWLAIGEIGESVGLRWGGRWKQPYDPGHLELMIIMGHTEGTQLA